MSARARRNARKIEVLAKMWLQVRSYWMGMHMDKRDRLFANMKGLAHRLQDIGLKSRSMARLAEQEQRVPQPRKGIRGGRP